MKRIMNYAVKHHLIESGDRIAVGLSGGADSVCLLFVLLQIKEEKNLSVFAVHINHHLRGEEALRDELFVRNLCEKLQVPLKIVDIDVADLAKKKKIGSEEAGRIARYEVFERYADEVKATKIALAHHQNDLAETMIWHLARGTDLAGLAAIRPKRDRYIRPLLCMNRQEIEQYLKNYGLEYVTDSTNREDCYTRNRIRNHVIRYLENEVNPQTAEHMSRTAESFGELYDYLQAEAVRLLEQYGICSEEGIFLRQELFLLPRVLVGYVLRLAVKELTGELKDITREHIERIHGLEKKEVGKQICLPYQLTVKKEYTGLFLFVGNAREKEAIQKKQTAVSSCMPLMIPGETVWEGYTFSCTLELGNMEEIEEKTYTKWLSYDKIKCGLVLRFRQSGDYIVVNEEGGTKKLKDYFIDRKIPQKERDQIPLLCAGSEVLWVCGHRISEAYKVKNETKQILKIQLRGGNDHE